MLASLQKARGQEALHTSGDAKECAGPVWCGASVQLAVATRCPVLLMHNAPHNPVMRGASAFKGGVSYN
jgi:hypothetical protein